MIKVLFATSEVAPLIKTGGLADVSGALPAALRAIGVDVRVLIPGYPQVWAQVGAVQSIAEFTHLAGFPASRLFLGTIPNNDVPLLILDCPVLFQRNGGPYQNPTGSDWEDNPLRFGLLSKVAALLGSDNSPIEWIPDVVHCNDWQTGLVPAYLHFDPAARARSVMTVHNLAFQGNFAPPTLSTLGLPAQSFGVNGAEFYGHFSFLKAGLFFADQLTTVSPTYAQEIQQAALGFGMQGLLHTRAADFTGILNGIDMDEWNPATDHHLPAHYKMGKMTGKKVNKVALQTQLGLTVDETIPLLGVVSRLTHQKGLDLLLEIAPRLTELSAQLVILGSGDAGMQQTARDLAAQYPDKIAVKIGFSETLSHQIEAGADLFIMPSRFEPCGLNQFYSQRYGTPPVVHATGGLADSVVDCTAETLKDGTASGFVFNGMTAENLYQTIARAISVYQDSRKWQTLRKLCMNKDFRWETSAEAYRQVYISALENPRSPE
ncbi:MAG: glycogen synthase GlgA [Gallionella sp.]|nr:glycogen synthase GlgA [Gallionella sp.]